MSKHTSKFNDADVTTSINLSNSFGQIKRELKLFEIIAIVLGSVLLLLVIYMGIKHILPRCRRYFNSSYAVRQMDDPPTISGPIVRDDGQFELQSMTNQGYYSREQASSS